MMRGKDSSEQPTLVTSQQTALRSLNSSTFNAQTNFTNRILSINSDAFYVSQLLASSFPSYPAFANLRCGAWYLDPRHPSVRPDPVYFKSTDGHINEWAFSLRRPNLHLLNYLAEPASRASGRSGSPGLVIVDSTRNGKKIPDALSKTVPIWCVVINRAILQRRQRNNAGASEGAWDSSLYLPPSLISPSEKDQIETRMDGWVKELLTSSYTLPKLRKPLRPIWVVQSPTSPSQSWSQTSAPPSDAPSFFPPSTAELSVFSETFHPIICVSASVPYDSLGLADQRRTYEEHSRAFTYVQGAGDDHESWSQGLTPSQWWIHRQEIVELVKEWNGRNVLGPWKKIVIDEEEKEAVHSELGEMNNDKDTLTEALARILTRMERTRHASSSPNLIPCHSSFANLHRGPVEDKASAPSDSYERGWENWRTDLKRTKLSRTRGRVVLYTPSETLEKDSDIIDSPSDADRDDFNGVEIILVPHDWKGPCIDDQDLPSSLFPGAEQIGTISPPEGRTYSDGTPVVKRRRRGHFRIATPRLSPKSKSPSKYQLQRDFVALVDRVVRYAQPLLDQLARENTQLPNAREGPLLSVTCLPSIVVARSAPNPESLSRSVPSSTETNSSAGIHIAYTLGILLVLLSMHFDDEGLLRVSQHGDASNEFHKEPSPPNNSDCMTKQTIRRRLEWIISDVPWANPPRWILRRVNELLMSSNRKDDKGV